MEEIGKYLVQLKKRSTSGLTIAAQFYNGVCTAQQLDISDWRRKMQNNDWMKTGEDILKSVLNAVEQQDFSGLSKNIENTINDTLGYVGDKINETARKYGNTTKYNATQEWLKEKQEREKAEQERAGRVQTGQGKSYAVQLYKKNPPGTYSGMAFQVLGIIGMSLFGLATFILTIVALATGALGVWLANLITGGFLAGSAVMLSCGLKLKNRVTRFRNYVKQIGQKQYCKIEELALAAGKKTKFVEREIRHMIDNGFFLQGHLDHSGTTLITSNDMYDKYLAAEASRKDREIEAAKQAAIAAKNGVYPEKVQQILEEGNRYIRHIHECNDAIPGEVMSQKLDTLENIMKRIFEQLKKSPESSDDLHKLMKYYLPTTTKLIDAYQDMDRQPSYGSNNIESTKKEIEDTLDIINAAFAKLLDDMFEETAWDISADISAMKTMLAKEGLTGERDFQM